MMEGLSEYDEVDREGLLGAVTRQTACNRCCASRRTCSSR